VDLVLLIAHKHDNRDVCFFAFHNPNGWVDRWTSTARRSRF